ncbi:hypothetical protein BGZ76_011425 [Entomortierella beljakovae]|nr:hypothetical protein BGZ76_011425 [Entomortierella beljakovae]
MSNTLLNRSDTLLTRSDTLKVADDKLFLDRLLNSSRQKPIPAPINIPRPNTHLINTTNPYFSSQFPTSSTASLDFPHVETVPYIHPCDESPQEHEQRYTQVFACPTQQQPVQYAQTNFNTAFCHPNNQGTVFLNGGFNNEIGSRSVVPPLGATIEVIHNPYESTDIDCNASTGANSTAAMAIKNSNTVISPSREEINITESRNSGQQFPAQLGIQNNLYIGQSEAQNVRRTIPVVTFPYPEQNNNGQVQIYSVLNELPRNMGSSQATSNVGHYTHHQLIPDLRQQQRLEQSSRLLPTHHTTHHQVGLSYDEVRGPQWKRLSTNIPGNKVDNVAQSELVTSNRSSRDENLDRDLNGKKRKKQKKGKGSERDSAAFNEPLLDKTQEDVKERKAERKWLDRPR